MLTAEIRVNCGFHGHIYIVNKGHVDGDNYRYEYEYYEPDKEIRKGVVLHNRHSDALTLIRKVIEDITK